MKQTNIYISIAVVTLLIVVVAILVFKFIIMKSKFIFPVAGRISSGFGSRIDPVTGKESGHNGIDLVVPIGTPIKAPQDGVIFSVFSTEFGGKQILIDHPGGYRTGYAHLSESKVKVGDKVKQGDIVALSGNTGAHTTGAHLHFTMRKNGKLVDPKLYLS